MPQNRTLVGPCHPFSNLMNTKESEKLVACGNEPGVEHHGAICDAPSSIIVPCQVHSSNQELKRSFQIDEIVSYRRSGKWSTLG